MNICRSTRDTRHNAKSTPTTTKTATQQYRTELFFSHSYKSTDYVNEHENRLKFKVYQIEIIKKREKEINRKREMRDDNITKKKEITSNTCVDVPRARLLPHTHPCAGDAVSSDTRTLTQSINRVYTYYGWNYGALNILCVQRM